MSLRVTALIWDQAPLDGSKLLTLLALADWANDDGECWPSIELLAKRARVSQSQAYRILAELESLGLLERPAGKRSKTKPFVLNLASMRPRTDATFNLAPVRNLARAGDYVKREPSKEPSLGGTPEASGLFRLWTELVEEPEAVLSPSRQRTIAKLLREEPDESVLATALRNYAHHAKAKGRAKWEIADAFSTFQGRDAEGKPAFSDLRSRINWLLSIDPNNDRVRRDKLQRWLDEARYTYSLPHRPEQERGDTAIAQLEKAGYLVRILDTQPFVRLERP